MQDVPPNFFAELKHRKVFRVAAGYIVIAWIALQFLDLVLDNINAPDWIMQSVMAMLAVGFPVALVLAWAFEVSADGIRLAPGRNRTFGLLIAAISVAALAYVGWMFAGNAGEETSPRPAVADSVPAVIDSIAVLPFESFSQDRQDEYFADGLADTLLHKLAQLSNLKVIARNSSFQFKGSNKDTREIGDILDVAALLEGSVQRQGDQVRVIAQLIDTSDGAHIWSNTYDDSYQNIFELQDRIAQEIMQQLQISISERDRMLVLRNGTDNPEAYDLMMRAIQTEGEYARQSFDPDTDPSLALVDQALALDPDHAQAWQIRAAILSSALFFSTEPARARRLLADSMSAAERAVEVAPEYASGYAALGGPIFARENIISAEQNFVRALELDPREVHAMQGLGLLKVNDDPQVALDLFSQAREIDPQDSFVYRQMFFALDALGRLDEGIAVLLDGVERFPDEHILKADVAAVYIDDLGQLDEAARLTTQILRTDGRNRIGLRLMTEIWRAARDDERTAAWFDIFGQRFPNSVANSAGQAAILLLHGDAEAARAILETTEETPDFRFDRSTVIAGTCLIQGDSACLDDHANRMTAWLDQYVAIGRDYGPEERYRITVAILQNAALPIAERNTADIQSFLDTSESWPVTGGRSFRYKGYLRAMLHSLLGNDREAALELQDTLAIGDQGFLYRDVFRLPPDINPLLNRLDGTPGYEQWLAEFSGRREQARGALVQMEREGLIIAAEDVAP